MYGDYALAGKGLKTLFLSEIVGLIATVLSGVALVGSLAGLAGLILGLVGLHTASPTHPYFKNAFFTSVGNIVANFLGTLLGESGFFSGGKAAAAFDYNNDTLRPADVAPNMENISHVTITYNSPNAGDTYAKLCYNGGGCASGILVMLNDQEAFLVETVYSTDESTPCWITIPLTLVKGLNTIYISCSVQNEAGQKTWLNYDFLDIKDPTVEYTPVTDLPEESTSDTETTEPETTESEKSAETSTLDTTEMVSDSIDAVDSNSDTTVTTSYSTDTKSEKPGADEVHKVPVALIVSIAIAVVAVAIVVVLVLKKKKS